MPVGEKGDDCDDDSGVSDDELVKCGGGGAMRTAWSQPFVFLLVASIAASDTTTAPGRIVENGDPAVKENK